MTEQLSNQSSIRVILPLSVNAGNKKFILNLNQYRNTHHFTLNEAKKKFTLLVLSRVDPLGYKIKGCELEYVYYHGSKGKVDISNPCSIIDKFTCDALTKRGFWKDDDYSVIGKITYIFGGVDKNHPRCELFIKNIKR